MRLHHGVFGRYSSAKRFGAKLQHKEPEQFTRLPLFLGDEVQVSVHPPEQSVPPPA
jgi:hypothetical protein